MEIFGHKSIKNNRKSIVPIQTVDHLIFQCKRLSNEREILKSSVLKVGKWSVSKRELTNGNLKQSLRHINSMVLEKRNHSNEQM